MKTLLVIEPSKAHPRHSEGDVVELKDGRLCLVYTRFRDVANDFAPADLVMRTSSDDGATWEEDQVLVSGGESDLGNVMSVSILRLPSDELLLFYLRKDSRSSLNLYLRRSSDEFATLSGPVRASLVDGYQCVNNDRAIRLSTGRLIVPANMHTELGEDGRSIGEYQGIGVPFVYYSDDDGGTWHKDETVITPVSQRKLMVQENGVVELKDGRLWMWMRTWHGSQYGCYSTDGGLTWSPPYPTTLASPGSPATIKRVPWTDDLLCVWNDHSGDHPYPTERTGKQKLAGHLYRRTPLCAAVSRDEGETWSKSRVIEGNMDGWFCYTSMTFVKDHVILSYMQRDESMTTDLGLKMVSLSKDWLCRAAIQTNEKPDIG